MIQNPIPEIISFLQETFGQITPQELADREEEIKNFGYDPAKLVDVVFNKITQYRDLCAFCKNHKTDPQLVQLAYIIFNKSRVFINALKEWNKLPSNTKTYESMKTHMRRNYHENKRVGALTIEDSSLQHKNLMNKWTTKQEGLMATLINDLNEQIKSNMYETMLMMQQMESTPPPLVATDTDSNTSESMNSLTAASTVSSLLTTMKSLQQGMKELKQAQQQQQQ